MSGQCFCTGKCEELGYCPNTETADEAIAVLEEQIEKIKSAERQRIAKEYNLLVDKGYIKGEKFILTVCKDVGYSKL